MSRGKKKLKREDIIKSQRGVLIMLGIIGILVLAIVIGIAMRNDYFEQEVKTGQEKSSQQSTGQTTQQTQSGAASVQQKSETQQPKPDTIKNGEEKQNTSTAQIETTKGNITVRLENDKMPITVNNFTKLVNNNFYNGLTFHRVEDWVIQGGDPNGDGTGGSGQTITLETHPELKNVRGAIAMARTNDPNSATSQFYILKKDASWLDGQYAVFGNVISGLDVVDKMAIGDKIISIKIL